MSVRKDRRLHTPKRATDLPTVHDAGHDRYADAPTVLGEAPVAAAIVPGVPGDPVPEYIWLKMDDVTPMTAHPDESHAHLIFVDGQAYHHTEDDADGRWIYRPFLRHK